MARNNGRVETQGLEGLRQAIQPAGLPGMTIVQAPAPPRINALLQIAESLSSVQAGLGSYAAKLRRDEAVAKNDPDKNGTNQAQIDYASDPVEFKRKLTAGEIPESQRKAYEVVNGQGEGLSFQGELAKAYDTEFDKEQGDIIDWTQKYRAKKIAGFTDNAAKLAFIKATDPMLDQLVTGHQGYLGKRLGQERIKGASANLELVIQEAKRKGWSPKLLQQNLSGAATALKNKGTLGLTGDESDAVLYSLAEKYSSTGDIDTASAVLNASRGGRGSLLQDPDWSAKGYKLLDTAYTAKREKAVHDDPLGKGSLLTRVRNGEATDDDIKNSQYLTAEEKASWKASSDQAKEVIAEKLRMRIEKADALQSYQTTKRIDAVEAYGTVMNGTGDFTFFADRPIKDKTGEDEETFSSDDRMKNLVGYHEEAVKSELQRRREAGWSDGDLEKYELDQHIKFYSRTRQPRKEWQGLLDNVATSVPEIVAAKAQVPGSAEYAVNLYRALRANNPSLLDDLVKDEGTRLFYETYDRALLFPGQTPQGAFSRAAEIAGKRSRGELPRFFAKDEDVDKAVKDAGFETVTGDARVSIYNMAEMLVQSGSPVKEALAQAAGIVSKRYTTINERSVFTGSKNIPSGFADAAEIKLDALVKQYGKQADLDDEDDLYLAPVSSRTDMWRVVRKDGLGDFLDDKGRVVTIDLPEIQRVIAMQADIKHWQDVDSFNKSRTNPKAGGGLMLTTSIDVPWMISKFLNERSSAAQKDSMIRDREGGPYIKDTRSPLNFPGVPGVDKTKGEGPSNWPGMEPPKGADILGLNTPEGKSILSRPQDAAAKLIAGFESFRSNTYWDVNHHRVGFGSDTITKADGTVVTVKKGMNVTKEDAQRDLARRVGVYQTSIMKVIGNSLWSALSTKQQATLTSIAYNYGELPSRVIRALKTGVTDNVVSAINSLRPHNGGVNAKRRRKEASLFASDGGPYLGNTANDIVDNLPNP